MKPDMKWLIAVYGQAEAEGTRSHIAVAKEAKTKLLEMSQQLVGTNGMVALYVPLGTDDGYQSIKRRGKIIGAVCLERMPSGKSIDDYCYHNRIDNSKRWPIGWPCRVTFSFQDEQCFDLRDDVEAEAQGQFDYQGYVRQLHHGPIKLSPGMQTRLNNSFLAVTE